MDIARRHELTFEEAEGAVELPPQLELGELSTRLRVRLWKAVHERLHFERGSNYRLNYTASAILKDYLVDHLDLFVDTFSDQRSDWIVPLKEIFESRDYVEVFGFVQFWLRHDRCDSDFQSEIQRVLVETKSAYRLFEGRTIAPISSEANAIAISRDLAAVNASAFDGAKSHLQQAAEALSRGDFPAAVRESIHAVDAVARKLAPEANDLGPALTALSKAGYVHSAMTTGFKSLYGYASNEKGIRHALLDDPKANVTEADALYMFGACAAFCAYLISKAREFGLDVD